MVILLQKGGYSAKALSALFFYLVGKYNNALNIGLFIRGVAMNPPTVEKRFFNFFKITARVRVKPDN